MISYTDEVNSKFNKNLLEWNSTPVKFFSSELKNEHFYRSA
jgi:hypothetical protein